MKPRYIILGGLIGVLAALLFLSLTAHGQTKQEPRATHICTVQENAVVDCGDFTLNIGTPWPAVWKGKTTGDQVFVHREGNQALPVSNAPPTCRERIIQAFKQHADGSLARGSVDAITPADCMQIEKKEREGYTKQ